MGGSNVSGGLRGECNCFPSVSEAKSPFRFDVMGFLLCSGTWSFFHVVAVTTFTLHAMVHVPALLPEWKLKDVLLGHRTLWQRPNTFSDRQSDRRRRRSYTIQVWKETTNNWDTQGHLCFISGHRLRAVVKGAVYSVLSQPDVLSDFLLVPGLCDGVSWRTDVLVRSGSALIQNQDTKRMWSSAAVEGYDIKTETFLLKSQIYVVKWNIL